MRVLFTGASSFTGYWFAKTLVQVGHELVCIYTKPAASYEGNRGKRVGMLADKVNQVFGVRFGDASFLEILDGGPPFDAICHHAADAKNHKAANFDCARALAENVRGINEVMQRARARGLSSFIATGTYFEAGEGVGTPPLEAFSPYALSKGLSWEVFRYYANEHGLKLGKYVLPNPIGLYDEPRFLEHLFRSWRRGEPASVRTPDYVRDNAPVALLARTYCDFLVGVHGGAAGLAQRNPSGWVETVGEFASRVSRHVQEISGHECPVHCHQQEDFQEPRVRANTEKILVGWSSEDERKFWRELWHESRPPSFESAAPAGGGMEPA
jgi:UDP-glucose 4-epimerase